MHRATDDELIAAFQAGRPQAFDRLLDRYQGPLFSYLLRMTGRRESAEDLFQETFLRVLRGLPGYEHRGQFKPWLYRLATNLCIDFFRREGRRPAVSLQREDGEGEPASLLGVLPAPGSRPDRAALEAQFLSALDAAVARLPEMQRQVFLLRTVSELSFREIADLLDCPLGTALGRMHDALGKLRQWLGDEWLELLAETE
ncbi:sigma-70 family RNA polymerase sigma factor [bacterium]|nr:sigma-70 family RNA polymerase sigma factor [bacterium]